MPRSSTGYIVIMPIPTYSTHHLSANVMANLLAILRIGIVYPNQNVNRGTFSSSQAIVKIILRDISLGSLIRRLHGGCESLQLKPVSGTIIPRYSDRKSILAAK